MVFGYITVQAIRASAMKDMVDPIVPKGPVKFAVIMEPGKPHNVMAVLEAIANAIPVTQGMIVPKRMTPPQRQPAAMNLKKQRR